MPLLCALLLFALPLWSAPEEDGTAILQQVRLKVAEQVKRSGNYTCVQTIDRGYFQDQQSFREKREAEGCELSDQGHRRKEVMDDHLRLDIAVSNGREIYSWHGSSSFSSAGILEIIHSGPVSSGSFIGYLDNIFLNAGILFEFQGRVNRNGMEVFAFNYSVPLAVSRHRVQGAGAAAIEPFHGQFFVSPSNFELVNLGIIIDVVPPDSNICRANIDMSYGLANISGRSSLIPREFVLKIDDIYHSHTVSRSDYTNCREFRDESTLHFTYDDAPAQGPIKPSPSDERLPAGMILRVRLNTDLSYDSAFTGDPVEGTLLDPIRVGGRTNEVIPKGATIYGIDNLLEKHLDPYKYFLWNVHFNHLTYHGRSLLLDAMSIPSKQTAESLRLIYGGHVPDSVVKDYRAGAIVTQGSKLHLSHYSGEWKTVDLSPSTQRTHSAH